MQVELSATAIVAGVALLGVNLFTLFHIVLRLGRVLERVDAMEKTLSIITRVTVVEH